MQFQQYAFSVHTLNLLFTYGFTPHAYFCKFLCGTYAYTRLSENYTIITGSNSALEGLRLINGLFSNSCTSTYRYYSIDSNFNTIVTIAVFKDHPSTLRFKKACYETIIESKIWEHPVFFFNLSMQDSCWDWIWDFNHIVSCSKNVPQFRMQCCKHYRSYHNGNKSLCCYSCVRTAVEFHFNQWLSSVDVEKIVTTNNLLGLRRWCWGTYSFIVYIRVFLR